MPERPRSLMPEGTEPTPLPPRPSRGRRRWLALGAGAAVLVLGTGAASAHLAGGDEKDGRKVVKIATTEAAEPYWTPLKAQARKEGIEVETVSFTDYTQPNPALAQGQVDLNLFQHLEFLAEYDTSDGQHLEPVGSTYVVPLGLYSKKHTKLSQLGQGATVAVPNDPTNQARALLLLQSKGLLRLTGGGSVTSTPAEIDKAASKVSVKPVAAEQTASALPSVDGSVVNNNFAHDAGLDPKQALAKDDPRSKLAEPYTNVIVARDGEQDDPTYRKIVKIFHSPAVEKVYLQRSKGTSVLVNRSPQDLERILGGLEQQTKKAQK